VRQNARWRKDFFNLGNQIRTDGLVFNDGNHFSDALLKMTFSGRGFFPRK